MKWIWFIFLFEWKYHLCKKINKKKTEQSTTWQQESWSRGQIQKFEWKQKAEAPIWQYFGFKANAKRESDNINEAIYKPLSDDGGSIWS